MIVLGICAVVIVVFAITAAMSDKVREAVISSKIYKKGFAVHMNLFSRIHNNAVRKHKEDIFEKLKSSVESVGGGDILEIGAGTGANFEFFPEGSSIIALEPNPHMVPYLRENAEKFPHVQLKNIVLGFAENMDGIPDASVAAVVCTMTLCSVSDVKATLAEIKRVLKPGGYFYFLEHIADEPETWRNSFQRRFDNQWKYLGDGCSCSRETWTHLDNASFSTVSYRKFDLKELTVLCYLIRPHLAGHAIK